jgi:hypothetical protein
MKMQLSADDQEARWAIYRRLSDAAQTLDENVVKANALIAQARSCLEQALQDYNNALADADAWSGKIVAEIEHDLSSASAECPDDAHRQNYATWSRHFREADFNLIHVHCPEGVILNIEDHPSLLADLPSRPGRLIFSEVDRYAPDGAA